MRLVAVTIAALVGLFACARFVVPEECRAPGSADEQERCDKIARDQLPEYRPGYMNGR